MMSSRTTLATTLAVALALPLAATAEDRPPAGAPAKLLPPADVPGPPPTTTPRDTGTDAPAAGGDEAPAAEEVTDGAPTGDASDDSPPTDAPTDAEIDALFDEAEVVIVEGKAPIGSGHSIDEEQLETFEHDDVHKALAAVPGVYVREEDGYGLRPNIGMRGSGSERSAKIALMEDGVLAAPAPYAAPAAYYFPLLTRMVRLDVLKGPAAIEHGPNTVGGSLNLISRPIPRDFESRIDLAAGDNLYGKLHATVGQSWEHIGFLVEGVRLQTDGYKVLDGGGDTGFDKNDVLAKLRVNTSRSGRLYNQVEFKLGYSDEVSNETYTGLTDADFAATPYRRYLGTRLDRMDARHLQFQLDHRFEFAGALEVHTTLYRNQFSRDWRKLDGFSDDLLDLRSALANPGSERARSLLAVLTGAQDSSGADDLLIGTNSREFVSTGFQSKVRTRQATGPVLHALEAGVRLHADDVERLSFGDIYAVAGGELVRSGAERIINRDQDQRALAWAFHARDRAEWRRVTATAGVRVEHVMTEQVSRPTSQMTDPSSSSDSYTVFIPGGGAMVRVADGLDLVAGVHRGFVPVAPGQADGVDPESSINYELGARVSRPGIRAEAIGFYSDYSNLSATCTVSANCRSEQIGDQFNGGNVHVGGVEALIGTEFSLGGFRVPMQASYTLNVSEFQTSFESENPLWGDVMVGDELPYVPRHQAFGQVGVNQTTWSVTTSARYSSRMRDQASQGDDATFTDDTLVVDLAGRYDFGRGGTVYATVNNVFDQANIVSRRPFGARPGVPRLVIVGYRNQF